MIHTLTHPIVHSIVHPVVGYRIPFARKPLSDIILALFANGEQGAYYDPYDLTDEKLAWVAANPSFTSAQFMAQFPNHTLFQDSLGTIPVTGHLQPVGLVLDKSGRNNHTHQPLSASRPLWENNGGLKSFWFDGVDDFLATPNLFNLSGTVLSSFVALRKTHDSTTGFVFETSPSSTANSGAIALLAPSQGGDNSYRFTATNNSTNAPLLGLGRFAIAPHSAVLNAQIDLLGTKTLDINNSEFVFSSNTEQTGVGFRNYFLQIARREGVSGLSFQGHIYSLIIRSALTPDALPIQQLLATRSGVAL